MTRRTPGAAFTARGLALESAAIAGPRFATEGATVVSFRQTPRPPAVRSAGARPAFGSRRSRAPRNATFPGAMSRR